MSQIQKYGPEILMCQIRGLYCDYSLEVSQADLLPLMPRDDSKV